MSTQHIWSRSNPLFFYVNTDKLDDLIERAYGEMVTEIEQETKGGTKGKLGLSTKFGGFLATLGLLDVGGQLETERSTERSRSRTVSITRNTKLNALVEYCRSNENLTYIDVYRGLVLTENHQAPSSEWPARPLASRDKVDSIGYILGNFLVCRVIPPHDDQANLGREMLMGEANNLWRFTSSGGSVQHTEIPLMTKYTLRASQVMIVAFYEAAHRHVRIEALGLLSWRAKALVCDPIACRISDW